MSAPLRRALGVCAGATLIAAVLGALSVRAAGSDPSGTAEFRAIILFTLAAGMLCLACLILGRGSGWRQRSAGSVGGLFAGPADAVSAVVQICRPSASANDVLRVYAVSIDGRHAADLRVGQVAKLTVAAGAHVVEAFLADVSSPPLTVDCAPGARIEVLIEPTPGNAAQRRQSQWLQLRER